MLQYDGYLVDWDGTAYDSLDRIYYCSCYVFKKAGLEPPDRETFDQSIENPFTEWIQSQGVQADGQTIGEWFNQEKRGRIAGFFPDAIRFMRLADQRDIKIGIISGNNTSYIERKLREKGLHHHFDLIRGETGHKVQAIRDFCDEHSLNPARTLMIGDLTSDVRDAKAAGVRSAALCRRPLTWPRLFAAGPNYLAPDFDLLSIALMEEALRA
jgi:phosphoglycolate phosphatase-like HAD superfamily hydrolase